jgi:hypothetical protein
LDGLQPGNSSHEVAKPHDGGPANASPLGFSCGSTSPRMVVLRADKNN